MVRRALALVTTMFVMVVASIAWAVAAPPASAAPIDYATGLPIGVQIIGPYLEDRTPIAFAELIEREFGGFVPPPGFA